MDERTGSWALQGCPARGIRSGLGNTHLAPPVSCLLMWQGIHEGSESQGEKWSELIQETDFRTFAQCKLGGKLSQSLDWGNGVSLSDTCCDFAE